MILFATGFMNGTGPHLVGRVLCARLLLCPLRYLLYPMRQSAGVALEDLHQLVTTMTTGGS